MTVTGVLFLLHVSITELFWERYCCRLSFYLCLAHACKV